MKIYSKKKIILFINKINKNLIKKKLLSPDQKILIGFSGGQDSFCLFLVFYQLKNQWNYHLNFIYCNHLWQIESFYLKKNIFKFFYLFKLPFLVAIPSKKIINEEKARNWRLNCFKRMKFFYQYNIILTGHTGNDRLETLIFNFFRGSSPAGLLSLKWQFNSFKNTTLFYNLVFLKTLNYKALKIVFYSGKKKKFYYNNFFFSKLNRFVKIRPIFRLRNTLKKKYLIKITLNNQFEKKFYYFLNKFYFFKKIKRYKIFYHKQFNFIKLKKQKKTNFLRKKLNRTQTLLSTSEKDQKNNIFQYIKYLKFFYFSKKYKIVRPFLSLNRFDTKVVSCSLKLPLYNDKSNEDINFFRNRIRKQIFPLLRFFFNPQIDNLFFQFIEISNSEQIFFNFLIKRLKKNIVLKRNNILVLNVFFFKKLPKTLQEKFLQKIIKFFINKKIKFYNLNLFLRIIKKRKSLQKTKLNFSDNKKFLFFENCIYFPEIGVIYSSSFFLIFFFNKK
uniref:tRNA(Ile)-lysidine synthase, chloroplastic n=1 Tax=Interfilum terricola TaxID=163310 RepID=A0A097KPN4_9VIRI|nr:hypothetical chloroplast RF62 [Interfilum terricola]AIT95146.1 hypothetical chloroplast RF62 [Interfilum terricola]